MSLGILAFPLLSRDNQFSILGVELGILLLVLVAYLAYVPYVLKSKQKNKYIVTACICLPFSFYLFMLASPRSLTIALIVSLFGFMTLTVMVPEVLSFYEELATARNAMLRKSKPDRKPNKAGKL